MKQYIFGGDMSQPSQTSREQLNRLRQLPLEPADYCKRWVKTAPHKGYRKACINVLAEATGLKPGTIRNWGTEFERRPRHILFVLRQADLLNQIEELERQKLIHLTSGLLQE